MVRAIAQLARKLGVPVTEITKMTIWGNHSATQYPNLFHAEVGGKVAAEQVEEAWLRDEFIPTVAKRGAAIIEARGASSAASAANAAIDHVHDWVHGTPEGDWTSAGVVSDGSYGVPEGLVSPFPVTSSGTMCHSPPDDVTGKEETSPSGTPYDPSDTMPAEVQSPSGVPCTHVCTWSIAALAADAADDAPRASMIAAPRLATVGMKVVSSQSGSTCSARTCRSSSASWRSPRA